MSAAREYYKHACLDALGMPLLVARRPLPGAAPSRPRLPAVARGPAQSVPPATGHPAPRGSAPVSLRQAGSAAPAATPRPGDAAAPAQTSPGQQRGRVGVPESATSPAPETPAAPARDEAAIPAPLAAKPVRFSLAIVHSADFLWLETLAAAGLSGPQRQLLAGMAAAVEGQAPELRETPFDWPLHDNPQLDRSAAAAAAALDGFLQRLLAERPCRGICLLGDDAPLGLVAEGVGAPLLRLPSTRAMLEAPLHKREAWRVLAPLRAAQA
ncbi:hypothetical protein [Haliea atlantica]